MTEPRYHRGALVNATPRNVSFADRPGKRFRWQWDMIRDHSQELTGEQLAKVSKPSRQRRKGPIVRFGGHK